ncbi:hypothetical protein CCMA1212_007152 [Trichoderma ghanense]|uniref:Uncharacterized protein n=1 Tax=Trichoderma ghanense TaxID=65468 RepID=A0ABY2GYC3_9HYPO
MVTSNPITDAPDDRTRPLLCSPSRYPNPHPSSQSPKSNLILRLQNPRLKNLDLLKRPVLRPRRHEPHPPHDAHAALDPPKDGVLPVEPGRGRERDEELRPVGVWPRVGHAEDARAGVLERRVDLVLELVAVDGGAAAAGARRVAALDHEVGDDAVEYRGVVVAALDEGGKVLGRFGGVLCVELEGDVALLI